VLTLPGGVHGVGPDLDLSIEHKSKARYASPQYRLGNKAYAFGEQGIREAGFYH